jgi:hypothetical protein
VKSDLLQFFAFAHLPPHLQAASQPFAVLADKVHDEPSAADQEFSRIISWIETDFPANPEATFAQTKLMDARRELSRRLKDWAACYPDRAGTLIDYERDIVLRAILEAKDCAVRARLYKPVTE